MYPDVPLHERLFMILDYLVTNAIRNADHTILASLNELASLLGPLFINPKTGTPTAEAMNWIRRLSTLLRKDKGHPHIRPYTEAHVEITPDGQEVVRYYLSLLMGPRAIKEINLRLEKQKTGLTEAQNMNTELGNVKKVMKEAEEYREYIEAKQRDANFKKRKGKKR